jgi:hypothetical protein
MTTTNPYLKFAAEVIATIAAGLVVAFGNDNIATTPEIINVVILALGAIAVLGAGNLPEGVWAYTKTIDAVATAVAVLLASVYTDGITISEWIQLGLAALGAAGVYGVRGPRVDTVRFA